MRVNQECDVCHLIFNTWIFGVTTTFIIRIYYSYFVACVTQATKFMYDCIIDYFCTALEAACAAYASLNLSLLHYITKSSAFKKCISVLSVALYVSVSIGDSCRDWQWKRQMAECTPTVLSHVRIIIVFIVSIIAENSLSLYICLWLQVSAFFSLSP